MLIEKIKGVGKQTMLNFHNVNIKTTKDLLLTYPVSYENYQLTKIDEFVHNEIITIKGIIVTKPIINYYTNVNMISFNLKTKEQTIKVIVFGRKYLFKTLNLNDEIIVKGKLNYYKNQIVASNLNSANRHVEIKPIYKIPNILDTNISKIVKNIYLENNPKFKEDLPNEIVKKYNFINKDALIKNAHLPASINVLDEVFKRLKYEEAYTFQSKLIKNINKPYERLPKPYDLDKVKALIQTIPFELTRDQKKAVNDGFKDFKEAYSSYRLIQGDVGSGKTVVAALLMYGAITAGEQVALMVPTEMLARQHYEYFKSFYPKDVKVGLLTSDVINKKQIYHQLANQQIDVIIGTHALIEDGVNFKNLGLVVIDEQHKFGVKTRDYLVKKNVTADLIYLTATPIPRTMAISLFGDAKISVIKEKPKARKAVKTKVLLPSDEKIIYSEVLKTLRRHEKIYIIAPAIDSDHATYNVNNLYEKYQEAFPDANIYMLHGKLKTAEQNIIINNFINDQSAILISTTMVEVGIDIKDATLILIYAANFFGLSQLHQLRGRVGRSDLASKCYLISDDSNNERLKILEKTNDGFLLSKFDLKLRGPGALIGLEQSGFPKFKYLDFINDYEVLKNARSDILRANNMI